MKQNTFFKAPREPKERTIRAGRKWFCAAEPIKSMDELRSLLEQRRYVFHRTKGYHFGWVSGWQFGYIARLIEAGQLFPGIRSRSAPYTWRAFWMHSRVPHLQSEFWATCDELRRGLEVKAVAHADVVKGCLEMTRDATGNRDARVHVVFRGEDER